MLKNKENGIQELIYQMFRIASMFSRAEQQPFALENGEVLSTREIHTVAALGKRQKMNVTQIGEYFGVTKGAASQMVKRLVMKGFLNKRFAAHSNKEYELSLTAKGQQAFAVHEQLHGKELQELSGYIGQFSIEQIELSAKLFAAYEKVLAKRLGKG